MNFLFSIQFSSCFRGGGIAYLQRNAWIEKTGFVVRKVRCAKEEAVLQIMNDRRRNQPTGRKGDDKTGGQMLDQKEKSTESMRTGK